MSTTTTREILLDESDNTIRLKLHVNDGVWVDTTLIIGGVSRVMENSFQTSLGEAQNLFDKDYVVSTLVKKIKDGVDTICLHYSLESNREIFSFNLEETVLENNGSLFYNTIFRFCEGEVVPYSQRSKEAAAYKTEYGGKYTSLVV